MTSTPHILQLLIPVRILSYSPRRNTIRILRPALFAMLKDLLNFRILHRIGKLLQLVIASHCCIPYPLMKRLGYIRVSILGSHVVRSWNVAYESRPLLQMRQLAEA